MINLSVPYCLKNNKPGLTHISCNKLECQANFSSLCQHHKRFVSRYKAEPDFLSQPMLPFKPHLVKFENITRGFELEAIRDGNHAESWMRPCF